MSIMPGIDTRAPERTETSSGLAASPKLLPVACSIWAMPSRDLAAQAVREALALLVIKRAHLGRDGEAGRHRQADRRHLGEVGALAAEQVPVAGLAVGGAAAEAVDYAFHGLALIQPSILREIGDAVDGVAHPREQVEPGLRAWRGRDR